MAIGNAFYVDPSALLKLYLREPESRAMAAWRGNVHGSLIITLHGKIEITNGIGLALHRGLINPSMHASALAAFDEDVEEGRYTQGDVRWRATLQRAADLSRAHTATLGCRSLDVMHVASALEMGLPYFVTFDRRQQQLAKAVKLKLRTPV